MAYLKMTTTMTRVLFQFCMKLTSNIRQGDPNLGSGRERKEEIQVKDQFNELRKGPMAEFIPVKV
jgi:hypothetical protein